MGLLNSHSMSSVCMWNKYTVTGHFLLSSKQLLFILHWLVIGELVDLRASLLDPQRARNERARCVLTPGELVLRCHRSLHQLGFDQPGAESVRVFGVMLGHTHRDRKSGFYSREDENKAGISSCAKDCVTAVEGCQISQYNHTSVKKSTALYLLQYY